MNGQPSGKGAEKPAELPPGCVPPYTVLPIALEPRRFYVYGAIRDDQTQWCYEVFLGDETHCPTCECEDHKFRRRGTKQLCKHLKAAVEFVERGRRSAADLAVGWFLSLTEEQRKGLFK